MKRASLRISIPKVEVEKKIETKLHIEVKNGKELSSISLNGELDEESMEKFLFDDERIINSFIA